MKLRNTILALTCLTTAGFAQDVRYNYANGTDFSQYKTYKWGQSRAAEKLDSITDRQLRDAVDAEMTKKGLVRQEEGRTDLLLVYEPSTRNEKQITSFDTGWGYGRGWGRRWSGYGPGITTAETSTIRVGEFALDIYDREKHELVWRGVASKTLDPNMKPEKWQKTIQAGAEKLLKNFPPPVKKQS
ncbi:DUF4136 domain-containing protein [Paludibaculum fermentans]|uniref:DUF4136 domain-containing protein n=1 Tax=Paludibaculum fermentans TaxID=1473598 RepID=UPI003EBA3ABC